MNSPMPFEEMLFPDIVPGQMVGGVPIRGESSETCEVDTFPQSEASAFPWYLAVRNEAHNELWDFLIISKSGLPEVELRCWGRESDSNEVRIVGPGRGARPRSGRCGKI